MPLESPVSVLYNSEGLEIGLSQSMTIATAQAGLMMAGSSSLGARLIRMGTDGSVFVTGSIDSIASGIQTVTGVVNINNPWTNVTGSNNGLIVNQGLSASNFFNAWKVVLTDASGSTIGLNASSAMFVTGALAISGTIIVKNVNVPTTTVSAVLASVTNYTILPVNTNRAGAVFYKSGAGTAFLKLGATASTTSYTAQLKTDSYYELPVTYTGIIDIIFSNAVATSIVTVTEFSY